MALTDKLTAIANAIRVKTGKSASMTLVEMPSEIASIQTGITPSGSETKTQNGTYDVTNLAQIVVAVNPEKCRIYRKTVPATQANDSWFAVNDGDADIAAMRSSSSERKKLNVFWYWNGLGSSDASGIKSGYQIGITDGGNLYGVYMRWASSSPTFGRADQWQPIQFNPSSNTPASGQCAIDANGKVYIGSHSYLLHAGEVIAVVFWE